jgi:Ca-activated chloride channel family protein
MAQRQRGWRVLWLVAAGCGPMVGPEPEHIEEVRAEPPTPEIEAPIPSGLEIRRTQGGGTATALPLTVTLERRPKPSRAPKQRAGRFGGRRARASGIVAGRGYGSGGSSAGFGGLGTGGRGHGQATNFARDGDHQTEGTRSDAEYRAFQYAELALPFRGGTPGDFPARHDVEVTQRIDAHRDWLSTFGIDVDTASYTMIRSSLENGQLPDPSWVRPEEMLNYFRYDYLPPVVDDELFAIEADGAESPLEETRHLLRIGIQARSPRPASRLPNNLVFLVDTSCSMTGDDRLEMAKRSIVRAVQALAPSDRVAITTYAGGVSVVLPPTSASERLQIEAAVARLNNGGGTAMQSGLSLAYEQAEEMRRPGTYTRVVVLSDGDANIGATTPEDLLADIAEHQARGITLSTIGFGNGNYRDDMMEKLANRGNGNYFYVDSDQQSRRIFERDLYRMISEVAADVKIQVELDADWIESYRLVGYDNRAIADEDFRDDAVDAGEIGEDHQVTALYELTLATGVELTMASKEARLGTIRVRAKVPGGQVAKETALAVPLSVLRRPFHRADPDLRFATAVIGAAELLRHSEHARAWSWPQVLSIARGVGTQDPDRAQFLTLIERAATLSRLAAR